MVGCGSPKPKGLVNGIGAGESAFPNESDMPVEIQDVFAHPVVVLPLEHDNDFGLCSNHLPGITKILGVESFDAILNAG
jgi:hypothetical protein